MAFVFDVNNATMTGAAAMFKLKELLKTAGWSVLSSGDGTSFFSGSDGITTGASGAGGWGNTNAWVRIRMPSQQGVTREFTIQRQAANTNWTIRYSYSAGFVGGSPSATVTPTATDQQTLGSNIALFGTDSTYRFNAAADNAAPYGFWMGCFPSGGGNPNSAWVMTPLNFASSGDIDPYVFYIPTSNQFLGSSMTVLQAWIVKGNTLYETFQTGLTAQRFFQNDGTGVFAIPSGLGVNPHTGFDDVFDIPIGGSQIATWPSGWKGFSTLIKWGSIARTTGDTLSVSTSKDRIVYRDCSLPWNGSTPTV